MNVARAAAIRAGLPVETSAMTINRFCSSGLQSIAMAADRIRTGGAEVIVAGGLETMSMIPMGGHIIRPNPYLVEHYPDFYLNMGLATENVARKYEVTREEQDEFALRSHQRAAAALDADKFKDETVPLTVTVRRAGRKGPKADARSRLSTRTKACGATASIEGLAKLKPAFQRERNDHRRQRFANVRRRRGGDRDVGEKARSNWARNRWRGSSLTRPPDVRRKRWALVRCLRFQKF